MLDILFVILLFLSWSGDEASWHWPLTRLFLWLTKAMKLFDIDLWPTILYMWPVFFVSFVDLFLCSLLVEMKSFDLWPVMLHLWPSIFYLLSAAFLVPRHMVKAFNCDLILDNPPRSILTLHFDLWPLLFYLWPFFRDLFRFFFFNIRLWPMTLILSLWLLTSGLSFMSRFFVDPSS